MALRSDKEDTVGVSGALTFASVPAIYSESRSLLTAKTGTVDLAEVTSVDSSGLALLLEWQSEAGKLGRSLAFVNAPTDLLRLAALSESTALLGLQARPEATGQSYDEGD
jgi:ABC-type transporter Mla MlaB component